MDACTTGHTNVAIGKGAAGKLTTAYFTTVVGAHSFEDLTTGPSNTGLGHQAGMNVTTGNGNTCIGRGAGADLTTGNNCTVLGQDAEASAVDVENEVTLGNGYVTTLRCNDTSISALSDRRDKTDIVDLPVGLGFINTLKPRKFKWQTRDGNSKDGKVRAGFIAQELQGAQVDNEYLELVMDSNPDKLEAKEGHLIPVLVKAIQELSEKVTALEAG